MRRILFTFALILFAAGNSFSQIKNFLFVGMDREQLRNSEYWKPELFDGVQVAYSWNQLEHTKDKYDFSEIKEQYLRQSRGKMSNLCFVDTPEFAQFLCYLLNRLFH